MRILSWAQLASGRETRLLIVVSLVVVLTASFSSTSSRPPVDLIVVQIPTGAESESPVGGELVQPADWYVDGARIVLLPASGGTPVVLTPQFTAACDPDVSFDGRSIVFAGKKGPEDSWQIWKMAADGSGKVQITRGQGASVAPVFAGSRFYLNDPAPTPQIIFASTRHGWRNERTGGPAFALYGTDLEGETVRRLTFNLNSDFSPDILPNGRIVFSSWQYHGGEYSPDGHVALFAVNLDGTDLMPYYGNHEAPSFKGLVHISDFDDRVYFIEAEHPERLRGGDIAELSQRRPLSSYHRLTFDQAGTYYTPVPLPDGGLIASYRAGVPNSVYGIYRVDPESGQRLEMVFEESGWHSIDAQVLTSHPQVKGRSNWLIPGSTTGVFYCLNSYRTNLFEGEDLAPGSIKYVRVIEGIPSGGEATHGGFRSGTESTYEAGMSARSATASRRLLGMAPVEEDGSFHIRVPAETPITFQLLDADYVALRTQHAWTWVIGNENRGCIGCHEDRELSPPNRVVDAVIKPPVELTLPPERRRTVDFLHQIAPIIEARCATAGCHVVGSVAPDLGVAGVTGQAGQLNVTYRTLLDPIAGREDERYLMPGKARESPLIWLLFGRRLGSEHTPYSRVVRQMPPADALNLRERIQFTEWVDLGALWDSRTAVAADTGR